MSKRRGWRSDVVRATEWEEAKPKDELSVLAKLAQRRAEKKAQRDEDAIAEAMRKAQGEG